MNTKLLLTALMALLLAPALAQNLPAAYQLSPDGRRLQRGVQPQTGFYAPETVEAVYLDFPQSNYWTQLGSNYASETLLPATLTYQGQVFDSVGVRFRGNTSYTTITSSLKKSFAVELNFVHPNQQLLGYQNLKFNNAHQDASFMREVLYCQLASAYTPIAKANYIQLYINQVSWGLYPNVQDIDKTFLREWFFSPDGARFRAQPATGSGIGAGWGDGTAGMNFLGLDTNTYKSYYSLKSSGVAFPWTQLVNAFQKLQQASGSSRDSLLAALDVDRALWFLAVENIFADDDSYIMKGKMDYMLYYEAENRRLQPLEYDGNSSFFSSAATSTNWGPFKNATNVNYPLLNKLLSIPEWRQRYLAHYRTILNQSFTVAQLHARIDQINDQIAPLVSADNKKLHSTAQYTSGVNSLKTWVTNRRNFLLSNSEVAQQGPQFLSVTHFNQQQQPLVAPKQQEQAHVQAQLASTIPVQQVYLYYSHDLTAPFNRLPMFDDGQHHDGLAGDGIYGASIPGTSAFKWVRYYVEAIAANAAASASYLPEGAEHDVFVYQVGSSATSNGVVINELLASNVSGPLDEAGDLEDWIELFNKHTQAIDLSGHYLSDNPSNLSKWQFPAGTIIPAQGYLTLWADDEPAEGPLHTSFKLSGTTGETLVLSDSALNILDQYAFGPVGADTSFARVPNGTGNFEKRWPTFDFSNNTASSVPSVPTPQLLLYPNPATTLLHLELGTAAQATVSVYDALGKLMYQAELQEAQHQIAVQNWPAGMYILRVQHDKQVHIKRFIKK